MTGAQFDFQRGRQLGKTRAVFAEATGLDLDSIRADDEMFRILCKYIAIVGEAEGVDFLYQSDWTPEEWEILMDAREASMRTEKKES